MTPTHPKLLAEALAVRSNMCRMLTRDKGPAHSGDLALFCGEFTVNSDEFTVISSEFTVISSELAPLSLENSELSGELALVASGLT